MEKMQVSREIVEKTQKYFREATKVIYFNELRFSQWKGYYNVFKASSMLNVPSQDVLNFARVLEYATVVLTSNEETIEHSNCKAEINKIVSAISTPKVVLNNENSVAIQNELVFSKSL